ncbi:CD59 glycoprotein [Oryzias melastigma]|uniref:CD59 glycoprotein n=1 Tax=Oryzias melastigma TaxID=30732 RepID=A0A834CIF5_ORYME|nr:CD59 glycoprotein [Oryzias melastigma]KAF6728018.1 CD59 glycoprotein [Oryzias melastigma]KAF6728028.1 CD59 glycoprotein [Oryzias melastigma]
MKLLVVVSAIALLCAAGEALNCHRCTPTKAGESCRLSVETCKAGKDACAAASFLRAPYGRYQKCMALSDCRMLQMNAYIQISCCSEDMCNTL